MHFTSPPAARYVVGFLFSGDLYHVLLIRKNHPPWQAGKLNGVGGKIEEGETPRGAMQREFFEESGMLLDSWTRFLTLRVADGSSTDNEPKVVEVIFFHGRCVSRIPPPKVVLPDEEQPVIVDTSVLDPSVMVYNLSWIIPLAIAHLETPTFHVEAVEHAGEAS
jgi:8-oxo-dGTP diphosphatase